ncbi:MAG TPA: FadR/GntR family transcriptional regulator [Bacillales bacterium]|nr:FadR/GntR family transcriptional regulator [Bacillales bacterium]
MMKLTPVKKRRIYHDIIEQIKAAIESGEIKPGEQLPSERNLAQTLSVSRTSVKEAISVLDSAGVVVIKPGVGIFLRENGIEDLILKINSIIERRVDLVEILELRQAIEGDSAYYAALRGTDQDLSAIEEAFKKLEEAVIRNDVAAKEDYEFHVAVCKAAKNTLLQEVMFLISDSILDSLAESRSRTLRTPGQSKAILDEHRRIFKAIESGDSDQAKKEMWQHLQVVKERFL